MRNIVKPRESEYGLQHGLHYSDKDHWNYQFIIIIHIENQHIKLALFFFQILLG
jgi:hypothetical protein